MSQFLEKLYDPANGLPDFVMLDADKVNEDGFLANLKFRFDKQLIYTYIGEQVISMNPFTKMDIYDEKTMDRYLRRYMYEVQPHIFALADDTFRNLLQTKADQCVIVTGESGAGKTEATKIFMQYVAKISPGETAGSIKGKLLDSNPVLEAFGNAKTVRNDNSSRFGKYMEIQFNLAGKPVGGKISQYLLEKSRVVTRAKNERAFHIFYQLLSSADLVGKLKLEGDPNRFRFLHLSDCLTVPSINDKEDFAVVCAAMSRLGFAEQQQQEVWRILAAILHMGNIAFVEEKAAGADWSKIADMGPVGVVGELLGVDTELIHKSLRTRLITTGVSRRKSRISVLLNPHQSADVRDTLAKALYNAVFDYVNLKLNEVIQGDGKEKSEVVIGILDIYGFEIFENNSFEQFCINYCNEKLQQLFIQLVLRMEQEEYEREGIAWTKIDYFDNQPIITLIEGPLGIYKLLDDISMVGSATTKSLLEQFDHQFGKDKYYNSWGVTKDKSINKTAFRVVHYAGTVDYDTEMFLDKNRDTLYQDLCRLIESSKTDLMKPFFVVQAANARVQRPKTAGYQFVTSVQALVDKLRACMPHYIRCIKSNETKTPFELNEERVRHQIRYLNLVETVRVRRAGFCNRQPYSRFLHRYKVVARKTWPFWKGSDADGVQAILDEVKIDKDEFRKGHTKLFIRNARTLFKFEELRAEHMPKVAIIIQKNWKKYRQRLAYKQLLINATLKRLWAGHEARVRVTRSLAAARIQKWARGRMARRFVKALKLEIKRNKAAIQVERVYRAHVARKFVKALRLRLLKEKSARTAQRVYRGHRARKQAKEMRTFARRARAIVRIQKMARGFLARKFVASHKDAIKKDREDRIIKLREEARIRKLRREAALKIQRHYRNYMRRRYVKELVKQLRDPWESKTHAPDFNFGKSLPWPRAFVATTKTAEPILKRMHKRDWARRKIAYWRASQLIQKRFRKRLDRTFVNTLSTTFNAPFPSNFGKSLPWPAAFTAKAKIALPVLRKLQLAFWAAKKVAYWRATQALQDNYRRRIDKRYMTTLSHTFAEKFPANFGKHLAFPQAFTERAKVADGVLHKLRTADWGRRKLAYWRATQLLQDRYRKRLKRSYVGELKHTFHEHKEREVNFGKNLPFPQPFSLDLKTANPLMRKLAHAYWGHIRIKSLSPSEHAYMRQKITALNLFGGKKPWTCNRIFSADYMDIDTNPGQARFGAAVQEMYQKYGDSAINFADDCIKVNRAGKSQHQVIIVTDKNIYKYTVKGYKIIKVGIPLAHVKGIHMSPGIDSFVVVEFDAPARDMVLDLGTNGCERVSEFATVVWTLVFELTEKEIPVSFGNSIKYNNNRLPEKPGIDYTLTFQNAAPDPKILPGMHQWKKTGPNTAVIQVGPKPAWLP